jgi:hypothetical protein
MKLLYSIVHTVAGVLTGFTSFFNPVLAVLMFIGFIIYELDESWRLSDEAYRDILDYLIGLYTSFASLILLQVIKWI